MNRLVKGVIFDWAGTTIDYGCMAPVYVIQSLFKLKGVNVTNDQIRKDMGLLKIEHLRQIIKIPSVRLQIEAKEGAPLQDEKYLQSIFVSFETEIKKILPNFSDPVPNLPEVLSFLKKNQLLIGSTTGYTKEMMDIVTPIAKSKGYSPDFWITSSQVKNGRPYPWMIYHNAEALGFNELHKVIKVGDTASDIQEGINAGCWTVGILEGSSKVGLSLKERTQISPHELQILKDKAKSVYLKNKADFIIDSIKDLPETIELISHKIAGGDRPQNMTILPKQHYTMFTPGPLMTSKRVKIPMMIDFGSREDDYLEIVQDVRTQLVNILAKSNPQLYTTVIVPGSGTFGVEAVVNTAIPRQNSKLLVLVNGQYGHRMAQIGIKLGRNTQVLEFPETEIIDVQKVKKVLENDKEITHVGFVHSETTTGLLNPVKQLSQLIKSHNKTLIVDSISSLGAVPFDANELGVDFCVGSSNKGFQSVPGFSFVIAKKSELEKTKGNSTSLALDLYDQWQSAEKGKGSFRFTSPTHTIVAFQEALKELAEEGGIEVRSQRYYSLQQRLVEGMRKLGFRELDLKGVQGPVITTFINPTSSKYDFDKFYKLLKENGLVIYPGKLTKLDTFRIGTIGNLNKNDIDRLLKTIENIIFWN